MKPARFILPIIVFSQFFCTSLWFAGNGVINSLVAAFDLGSGSLGHLTSSVQFGFIIGTLVFAILALADRFSPSKVFFWSALSGALFNLGVIWEGNTLFSILILRFLTGFFLAGIYPVGMKIAADYFEKGLGRSLGFLVGALVLGTAFPHLLREVTSNLPWKSVFIGTSLLASLGGTLMFLLVPDGPFRKPSQRIDLTGIFKVFNSRPFRASAFGYFGHMWELYAFWTFVPIMLTAYQEGHSDVGLSVPLLFFIIIGIGGLSCMMGGILAERVGVKRMAFLFLLISCTCSLASPFLLQLDSTILFLSFLLIWGMTVIADSPLLSTLVAQNAIPEIKGTALTIVNCIGFSITIVSIQLISFLRMQTDSNMIYLVLALGPILGLLSLSRNTTV